MPDATMNYTPDGWPYLDDQNYVDIIDNYTVALANKLQEGMPPAPHTHDASNITGTLNPARIPALPYAAPDHDHDAGDITGLVDAIIEATSWEDITVTRGPATTAGTVAVTKRGLDRTLTLRSVALTTAGGIICTVPAADAGHGFGWAVTPSGSDAWPVRIAGTEVRLGAKPAATVGAVNATIFWRAS